MRPPDQEATALVRRRKECLILLDSWKGGDANLDRVLNEIVEIWTGNAERIVRVGETPKPEIQS